MSDRQRWARSHFKPTESPNKLEELSLLLLADNLQSSPDSNSLLSFPGANLIQELSVPTESVLISGGDDRMVIDKNGINKYGGSPIPSTHNVQYGPTTLGVINRASCTCSPVSSHIYQVSAEINIFSIYFKSMYR